MTHPRHAIAGLMSVAFWAGCVVPASAVAGAPLHWSDSLVGDGGGYWRARAILELSHRGSRAIKGEAFGISIGRGQGQIDLVGRRAEAVRVCDALGRELLFDLTDRRGYTKHTGTLAAGDRLSFCIECPAAELRDGRTVGPRVRYAIYSENPKAATPADYLRSGLVNGGFERGRDAPEGWRRSGVDDVHHVAWVMERPRSGRYCGRTTVHADAKPTWVKWHQTDVLVSAGARYRLTGWVRAENVKGRAGWYVHVHAEKPMVVNQTANAGEGTYDWKKVFIEFATPPGSRVAGVGTLLHGTGTAWFDDASLERLDASPGVRLESVTVERRELTEIPGRSGWLLPAGRWPCRVTIVAANARARPARNAAISANLNRVIHRIARPGRAVRVAVIDPARSGATSAGDILPSVRLGRSRLFVATLPPRCRKTFHVYLAPANEREPTDDQAMYAALLRSGANLAKNGDFEAGDKMPEAWRPGSGWPQKGKAQCKLARVAGGLIGEHCGRLDVPPGARLQWSGWLQGPIPVQPNETYMYAGWLKSRQVNDGKVALHGHYHGADGKLAKAAQYFSTTKGLSGDTDWSLSHALVQTPGDCASVILHLTMNAHGTVWHDGIVFCRVAESKMGALETTQPRQPADDRALHIWQVNPLVKVLRDDPPQEQVSSLRADAAANEYEPLQFVIRGQEALRNVRVEVSTLRSEGRSLPPVRVDRVGYVPVDRPSSYYHTKLPAWYRWVPRGTPRTDGWAGDWPDPLPPCRPFDLPAGQTQPIWLTVHVPGGTPAGAYRGQVTIRADGGLSEQIPLRVNVWPFELPVTPSLRVIYDLRRGPGEDPFGDGSIKALRKWYTLLARHRISPGLLPSPVFKYRDGKVEMDTAAFDAAARVCLDELGMNVFYSPHLFYAFGWAYKPRPLFGHEAFTDEYQRAFKACYRAYLDHLKKHGWYDKLVNYISDEPHYAHEHVVEQMKQVCNLAHSVEPNVPLYSSTWRHVPAWNGFLDIWGVGQYGCFAVDEMKRRQAKGERIWFTTDGQQALDTPYLATERLLPYYCFKYGATGYEFWGVSWWTYDPWDRAWHRFISQSDDGKNRYRVRYPNGDGYLTYPGERVGLDRPVSSIRLEQVREGIEDYEYLCILRDLIERVRQTKSAAASREAPRVARVAQAVRAAEAVLDRARALVTIPNAGGNRSTEILPDPDAVPAIRRAVAEAIVKLKGRLAR